MFRRKPKVLTPEQMEEIRTKDFFDMILPGNIKFFSDHYIMGDSYRSVWVIREYPPSTEEQAILSQLADRNGVTLRIYHRLVESMEQRKILQNATRKNKLMSGGNNVNETIEAASIDELYLFLTNMTAIEYIRNAMKRVRKKDSAIILASQNIEDFLIPSIREFTKPLFSISTHQFLFNVGQINPKDFMDALQVEQSEFELIKYPERGTCLYRCGNERYLLQVIAPDYKSALFGKAGGR